MHTGYSDQWHWKIAPLLFIEQVKVKPKNYELISAIERKLPGNKKAFRTVCTLSFHTAFIDKFLSPYACIRIMWITKQTNQRVSSMNTHLYTRVKCSNMHCSEQSVYLFIVLFVLFCKGEEIAILKISLQTIHVWTCLRARVNSGVPRAIVFTRWPRN